MAWAARNAAISNGVFNAPISREQAPQAISVFRGASQARTIVSEPQRAWGDAVKDRFDKLCALPKGWNGYSASAVTFSNASFALQMLQGCCPQNVPVPSIIPGTQGDLQIEWHMKECDIELHVRCPYDVHAWRRTIDNDDGEEVHLTNDFTVITHWIREMVEPKLAAKAAAA